MMRARGEVALAVLLLAAAALVLSSLDSRSDVRLLEIGDADAELLLLPLLDGAVGPESLVFADDDDGDGGPFTGVSDGRVLRWVPADRRWAEHSSSAAPEDL